MIGVWNRLVAWATAPADPLPLAIFRVGVALGVLTTVGSVVTAGLVEVLWVDVDYGGYRALGRQHWLVDALGGATPDVMWGLVGASLVGAVLMVLGLGGRLTALFTLQVTQALVDANSHAGGSYDQLLTNALWLCVLTPTTATASLDAWIGRGHALSSRAVHAWCRVLVVYQIILVYWSTGVQKVSAYWTPGGDFSALYYILQQPSWQRYPMTWLAWVFPLTQVATAVTWAWEVTVPLWLLAIYFQATRERPGRLRAAFNAWDVRSIYAVIGLLFHAVLLATLDVGPFPIISLAFYACLWRGEEWRSILVHRS